MGKEFKIVIEKHPDRYVAYPLGMKGVVIGQGDTFDEALADVGEAAISRAGNGVPCGVSQWM
ncbi:MAG: type II toxin-antitoxin system HicB family antitoxin [Gammaproteobacteria bacterium]